jgi:putative inorganic carbon (HCO3(-)) transporter
MTRAAAGRAQWWQREPSPESGGPEVAAPAEVDRDSPIPFAALLVFLFVLFVAPQNYLPVLAPLRLAFVAGLVAIATHVLGRFSRGRRAMIFTPETSIVAAILGWAVVTVPWSYWPGGSVGFLVDVYFKTVAIFWLLANTVTTPRRLRTIAWAITLMAVPLAVTAVQNFAAGSFIADQRIAGYDSPLAANPNDLALLLNLILPFAVALLLGRRALATRALLLAVVGLLVAGVIVTFSRAGFLTLAAIFLTYLFRLFRRGQWLPAFAAVAVSLVVVAVVPEGYRDRLHTITDMESDPTGSAQARWGDTVVAARFVLDHPVIGAGIGMNVLALNDERGAAWTKVHNAFLEYGVDLGIPGAVLFILLVVACLKSARSVRKGAHRPGESEELPRLAEGIEVALVAFVVAAMFHPVAYHFYFYLIAGLAVATRAVHRAQTSVAVPRPAERRGDLRTCVASPGY